MFSLNTLFVLRKSLSRKNPESFHSREKIFYTLQLVFKESSSGLAEPGELRALVRLQISLARFWPGLAESTK